MGCVIEDKNFANYGFIKAPKAFMAPYRLDNSPYCPSCEDTTGTPLACAAAVAAYAKNTFWRLTGEAPIVDTERIYAFAKMIDNARGIKGTSIISAMKAAIEADIFPRFHTSIALVKPNRLSAKYAIHRFGAFVACMNLVEENSKSQDASLNAVLACGYDKQGITIQNYFGPNWGKYGFRHIEWAEYDKSMRYGVVIAQHSSVSM